MHLLGWHTLFDVFVQAVLMPVGQERQVPHSLALVPAFHVFVGTHDVHTPSRISVIAFARPRPVAHSLILTGAHVPVFVPALNVLP